jgi:hypothetical protein
VHGRGCVTAGEGGGGCERGEGREGVRERMRKEGRWGARGEAEGEAGHEEGEGGSARRRGCPIAGEREGG